MPTIYALREFPIAGSQNPSGGFTDTSAYPGNYLSNARLVGTRCK
jgi:hypothetical protein